MFGCNHERSSMSFDEVKYVDKFPLVRELAEKSFPAMDVIGVNDFRIIDFTIVFSLRGNDSLWACYSLPDFKPLGKCFTRGSGPNEFLDSPNASYQTDFFRDGADLSAVIYEFQTGRVVKADIGNSLKRHESVTDILCDTIPPFLFNFIAIDDTTFFCKKLNYSRTQQLRYIQKGGMRHTLPAMETLNNVSVGNSVDINILSTISKINHANHRIVEMPIRLSHINLYSLSDSSFMRTICMGGQVDDIRSIERTKPWDCLYTFSDVRVYRDFFAVMSIQEGEKDYQVERKKLPTILFFDWDGDPLAELKLNRFVSSFDIDFKNGTLYAFDVQTDKMYAYDAAGFLTEIGG